MMQPVLNTASSMGTESANKVYKPVCRAHDSEDGRIVHGAARCSAPLRPSHTVMHMTTALIARGRHHKASSSTAAGSSQSTAAASCAHLGGDPHVVDVHVGEEPGALLGVVGGLDGEEDALVPVLFQALGGVALPAGQGALQVRARPVSIYPPSKRMPTLQVRLALHISWWLDMLHACNAGRW
jgi:hypothetical protein